MKLMTKEIEKNLPPLYSTDDVPLKEKKAVAKFFDPTGRYTAFVFEGEKQGDDFLFFAYVISPLGPDCDEMGYVSLKELESVKGRLGLGIERDIDWTPDTLPAHILVGL